MDDKSPDLARKALRGVPLSIAAYVAGRGLSVVGTLVLARLLAPEDIGLVLTGVLVNIALNTLTDSGFGLTLVVLPELTERMIGTVLSCVLVISALVTAVAVAGSGVIATAFNQPRLEEIMPWLALAIPFSSLNWFFSNLLQRDLYFGRRFAGQFALAAGYVAVAIPAAIWGAGVWALVAGQLAGALLSALVGWAVTPRRVRLRFHLASAREAFRTARAYLGQGIVSFLSENLHLVAVAGLLGARPMALYSMSYRLTELPTKALAHPVSQATFPAFAHMTSEQQARRRAMLVSLRYVALGGLPLLATLAVLAGPFVEVVLGPDWDGMQGILVILCVWGAFAVPGATMGWYVNALGGADWLASVKFARVCVSGPAVFAAAAVTNSFQVVGWILVVDAAAELALLMWYAHRRLDIAYGDAWVAVRPVLGATLGLVLAAVLVRLGLSTTGVSGTVTLLLGTAAALLSYLLVAARVEPNLVPEGRRLLKGALSSS